MSDKIRNAVIDSNICNDLRALKKLAVKQYVLGLRHHEFKLETLCAVSVDAAIAVMRESQYWDFRRLQAVAQAENAMRELADHVDRDGSASLQLEADPGIRQHGQECEEALRFLADLAKSENGNLAPEDEERKKTDALNRLVPRWRFDYGVQGPVTDEEATITLNTLRRIAGDTLP